MVGWGCKLATRSASAVRIRACLQACRKCRVMDAPSGAEAGDWSFTAVLVICFLATVRVSFLFDFDHIYDTILSQCGLSLLDLVTDNVSSSFSCGCPRSPGGGRS
jgi:hypothetical protein